MLAGFVLVTVLAGISASRGVIASSMGNFLGESPSYGRYLELARKFMNDEMVVIGVEEPDPLSPSSIARLKAVCANLKKIEGVRTVASALDVTKIEARGGDLGLDTYADKALEHPEKKAEILAGMARDPLARGLFLSGDGAHSLVLVELEPDEARGAEEFPALQDRIISIFVEHGFERDRLHPGGVIAVMSEVMHQTSFNISRLFPIVCVVLLITVFVMFRRLWPVVITAIVALIAVIWTMGFAVLLFKRINVLMAMAPVFLLIVSFSDVIHLCSAYLLELSAGRPKKEAIEKSAAEVGRACLFTSLTTFAGFASLALVPAPISRQLGVVLGFGIAIALLIAMTLTPILFSIMRPPKPWKTGAAGRAQDLLDRVLDAIESITARRPALVAALFTILLVVSVFMTTRMEFMVDFAKRFPEDNPVRVDGQYLLNHFAGTNQLNIYIQTPEKDGLLDPELLGRIWKLEQALPGITGIDRAASVVDVLRAVHKGFHPEDQNPLPRDRRTIAQYLFLLEMSDEGGVERMIDYDRRLMPMTVFLNDDDILETHRIGERALARGREIIGDGATLEALSLKYILGKEFDKLFLSGQRRALGAAVLTVFVMMVVAMRSLSWGLWSMIPNVIPLFALGGYLGAVGEKVDTDVLIIFMVAIGIGVDDTIHFLTRYRVELERGGDVNAAVENAFHYSGRAIIITSVILVAGFLPFAISDYFTTNIMGTLMPACLVMALLADLFLVPAMIKLGAFRPPKADKGKSG